MARSLLALLALGAVAVEHVAAAELRVVRMPMYREQVRGTPLRKRAASPQSVTLGNAELYYLYYVNATVGSPGQDVALQIDTGSSDIWMFGPQVCETEEDLCEAGYFNPSDSSTYKQVGEDGLFEIEYVTPGSGVKGNYFQDDFSIGSIKLTGLTMAVATEASSVNTGIMGIGFDADESIVSNSGGAAEYHNIIDIMVSQGVIASHSYSLYLDDREAATGSVLFGGYDTAKYTGPLTVLDIQPDSQSGNITSFTVAWSYLGVTTGSDGSTTLLSSSEFPIAAVLDSGTSLTVIPQSLFNQFSDYFSVTDSDEYGYIVPCSNADMEGALVFGFGGSNGAVIQVPFSELALPTVDASGNPLTFRDGTAACSFGLDVVGDDSPVLLGDTFLRSAYVIYDLDAKQIAIAQASYNATAQNVQEIAAGTDLASILGSAASIATGVTATQTASGQVAAGTGHSNSNSNSNSGDASATSAASGSSGTDTAFEGTTTHITLAPVLTSEATTAADGSGGVTQTAGTTGSTSTGTSSGAATPRALSYSPDLQMWFASSIALFVSGATMMLIF